MTNSGTIGELFAALSKAQGEIAGAKRDVKGQVGKSIVRYADLASIWLACRDALSKYGLSVLQPATSDGRIVTVTTMLAHASGGSISEPLSLEYDGSARSLGMNITYLR